MCKETNVRPLGVTARRLTFSFLSRISLALLFSLPFTAVTGVAASTATARKPSHASQRRVINAKTVYVRDRSMRIVCTLRRGETFDIFRSAQGGYVFGFAHGHCRREGFVKRDYLE